jgi:hypothetical protein
MANIQNLQLYVSVIEPNAFFATWNITSGEDPIVNSYYVIYVTILGSGDTRLIYTPNMNHRIPVEQNTTYVFTVKSVTFSGASSNPSNFVTITSTNRLNLIGLASGLRPFNKLLVYQLNIERICDNAEVILPYPTYIDITKKPFYQYYKIQQPK